MNRKYFSTRLTRIKVPVSLIVARATKIGAQNVSEEREVSKEDRYEAHREDVYTPVR